MSNIVSAVDKNAKIAVLAGGMSSEKDVSMRSGSGCLDALHRLGYKNAELVVVDTDIASKLKEGNYDYAFNALHGKYGEDGCIQGILEILKIPYTGCGVMASSLCMNKEFTKRILSTCPDIPMAKSAFVKKGDDLFEKTKDLTYPLFVKPVSEGSSFGMTKVDKKEDLKEAYETAIKYNDDVLIEEFIDGFFVTVGVLEKDGKAFATEILEIRPKNDWYDFEAKYTKGMSDFICPANLSKEVTERVKDVAVKDTSPGMTTMSDLPAQAKAMGIDYDNLVQLILNSAGLNK